MRFDLFSSGKLYRALRDAGYADLPSERTVRRWTEGSQPPPSAVELVARLIEADTKKEAPAPEWAEALAARTAEDVVTRLEARASEIRTQAVISQLEELLQQRAVVPLAETGSQDPVE